MKSAWKKDLTDLAAWNSGLQEEVDMTEFEDLLAHDDEENKLVRAIEVEDARDIYIPLD